MGDEMRYVVCYDVSNTKRRTRMAKTVDGFGDRVQGSVFEVRLNRKLYDQMLGLITEILDPDEDRVSVYPLCGTCEKKVIRLGTMPEPPGEEEVFVV